MDDLISKQAAIEALDQIFDRCEEIEAHLPEGDPDRTGYKMFPDYMTVWKYLHQLSSVQSEIIYCKDCRKHNVHFGYKKDCCALYEWRGISYGHEHDYQYCCHAERRTDA